MNNVIINSEMWELIDNFYDAFQFLRKYDILSVQLWRAFHCQCCREIWTDITDHRGQVAVETAERFIEGKCTEADLCRSFLQSKAAADELWQKVVLLRMPSAPNVFDWPTSKAVDDAWTQYLAVECATTCAKTEHKDLLFVTIPESPSVYAWKYARTDVVGNDINGECVDPKLLEMRTSRWLVLRDKHEQRLLGHLRNLVEQYHRPVSE